MSLVGERVWVSKIPYCVSELSKMGTHSVKRTIYVSLWLENRQYHHFKTLKKDIVKILIL